MKILFFTMLIAVVFSFDATANSNLEIPVADNFENISSKESQSVSFYFFPIHPCVVGYINTYIANVDHYGDEIATAMAQAAYDACAQFYERL